MGAIRHAVLFSLCLFALAGCGGGGGGSAALPPVMPPSGGTATAAPASLLFTIAIPSATGASGAHRSPRYISAGTKSATISFGANRQTVNCASSCTATLTATPGQQTFTASLYDQPNGAGNVLSVGTTTATVVAGAQNTVSVTFDGIPARLALALGSASVNAGRPAQIPLVVQALDAAGYTIVGPEPFADAIALASDDHSGATTLSRTTLASPNDTVTLGYNGSAAVAAVHLSVSVPGAAVTMQTATLTIVPAQGAPAPTPTPTGTFPDHVRTLAYYGLNGINADVPAAFMAAHVEAVEDDGYTAQHADAFKRAGGHIALAYTDPAYAAHCPAPFTAPAGKCTGQIANLIADDESAFVHDATGARVHRFVSDYFQYQEVFNVGASAAQRAYAQTTAAILAASPLLDGFEADDSGGSMTAPDGVFGSLLFYNFNAAGVEIPDDAAWIAGESAMLAAAGKPLMLNGGDAITWGPAYNGAFLDQPYVMSQQFEGCFNNDANYLYTDWEGKFVREENGLLAVTAHHKSAVCYPTGDTSPPHRLYAYAAWLLTYDPVYSVYEMDVPMSDNEALYPESQLVPTQPRATATDVAQLRSGGAYVREFAACGIAGVAIGPCATVVNASQSASAAVPSLAIAYGHQIVLDPQSFYHGGKANVVAGAPTSLAAATAAILVR
jgi:hypothetical protein